MRAPLIALLCGLAAAVALLALREDGEPRVAQPAPLAPTPASAAESAVNPQPQPQPPPQLPTPVARPSGAASAASTVAAAVVKPAPSAASPVHSPFALSSDHQALINDTVLAAADHELLEREPRDDAWATESERLIRQELARHRGARDFDIIAVDCRETLCAIQAFSYGENGHRAWVGAVDELYKETLANVFDSVNTAFPTQDGRRSPVVTFLHRTTAPPKR